MAKKANLVCRPCGYEVIVSDLGTAVVECYACGVELEPAKSVAKKPAPKKALKAAAPKKPAAKKAAPKKKK